MPEAMNLVKKELGNNAVILHTKNVKKKGLFQFFGNKQAVEVFAAIDQGTEVSREEKSQQPITALTSQPPKASEKRPPQVTSQRPQVQAVSWTGPMPPKIKNIYDLLISEGLSSSIVDQVVQAILKAWYTSDSPLSDSELKKVLTETMGAMLNKVPFMGIKKTTKVLNLVGPTGVGKTTTAAKLASRAVIEEGKKVAFITTDTYRIAAIEQLKTYAKILDIPVEVAYSREDFEQAIKRLQEYDLIIVDTAGRNYQQVQYIDELKKLIPFHTHDMETYLVLSATTKPQDIERIAKQFEAVSLNGYVFTKLDETSSIGSLMNLVLNHQIGVSYFTNGQDVPDDLIEADKQAFLKQLIEGVWRV